MAKLSNRDMRCTEAVSDAAPAAPALRGGYHEEGVDDDIEVERRERGARIVVAPEADLHRHYDGCVEQQRRAAEEHPWARMRGEEENVREGPIMVNSGGGVDTT
jgi:hypothetical protein